MSMICCLREADVSQITRLLSDPAYILPLLEEEGDQVDLDKAWHGIHFLLTGSAWGGEEPLCYLVKGGAQVGDVDVGYGPARVLRPDQVTNWSAALSAISEDELRRRFNRQAMAKEQIYPEIWDGEREDESIGYLLEYYGVLRTFVKRTGAQQKGALIYIA